MVRRLLFLFSSMLLFSASVLVAQERGIDISGSVKEGWKGLEGAKLTLYKDGRLDQTIVTPANGKFKFFFQPNATYLLDVSKAGYVAKKIEFNTAIPAEVSMVWDFDFIVELFQDQSGLNKAIFTNPVAKVQYSERHNEFDYDLDYSMEFQKQEEKVFEELEKLKEEKDLEAERLRKEAERLAKEEAKQLAEAEKRKQAEAEAAARLEAEQAAAEAKAKAEAEKQRLAEEERKRKEAEEEARRLAEEQRAKEAAELKAKEDEFAAQLKEADQLLAKGEYEQAKAKLEQASRIFPDRKETAAKLEQAKQGMAKLKAEQEERERKEKQFSDLMAQAADLVSKEKYEAAINIYETAADMNPNSNEPVVKLKELKETIAAIAKQEQEKIQQKQKFDQLIADAQRSEAAQKYEQARGPYQDALDVMPEAEMPKERIKAIDAILAEMAKKQKEEQERNAKITALLADGDKMAGSGEFQQALSKFNDVLALDPENKEAQERLNSLKAQIQEQERKKQELAQKQEQFTKLISEGGTLQSSQNFESAKQKYQEAAKLGVDDGAAKARLQEVEQLIAEAEKKARELDKLNKQADELVKAGIALVEKEKYEEAKQKASEALALMPEHQPAKGLIEQIDRRLADLAAKKADEEKRQAQILAQQQQQFNALIEEGDDLASMKDLSGALKVFEAALQLNVDNARAEQKISDAKATIAKLDEEKRAREKLEKDLEALVAAATELLSKQKFDAARSKVQEAINLKSDHQPALSLIAEITKQETQIAEAKVEAERLAAEEKARLEEEKRQKAEAEAAAKAEAERLAAEEKARLEEEKRQKAEAEALAKA